MYDIFLCAPAVPAYDIILHLGPCDVAVADIFFPRPLLDSRGQPVYAVSMYNDLVGRYGRFEGERIYYALAREKKGAFADGAKYETRRPGSPSTPVKEQLDVDPVTAAVPPVPPRAIPLTTEHRTIKPPPRKN